MALLFQTFNVLLHIPNKLVILVMNNNLAQVTFYQTIAILLRPLSSPVCFIGKGLLQSKRCFQRVS